MASDQELAQKPPEWMLFERLGAIEAKLDAGKDRHEKFEASIADLTKKVELVPGLCMTVEKMQPIVDDYVRSRNIFTGLMVAIGFLIGALAYFAAEIKLALRAIFLKMGS